LSTATQTLTQPDDPRITIHHPKPASFLGKGNEQSAIIGSKIKGGIEPFVVTTVSALFAAGLADRRSAGLIPFGTTLIRSVPGGIGNIGHWSDGGSQASGKLIGMGVGSAPAISILVARSVIGS
jgi:hypothetical protein